MSNQSVNTYTDHPAYQQPIKRTVRHNKIRYWLGMLFIVMFSIPIMTTGFLFLLKGCYDLSHSIYTAKGLTQVDTLMIATPLASAVAIALGVRTFCWFRHMTRSHSREFT